MEFLDSKASWIVYYSVSLAVAIIMINGASDKDYRIIGVLFVLTFSYFLISYFGLIMRMGLEFITITVAFIWYAVKRIKQNGMRLRNEILLLMLPLITVFRLGFKILQLPGWDQLGFISLLIIAITIIYWLIYYLRGRTFDQLKEAVELNGLFGVVLMPTLVYDIRVALDTCR